jgi:hypothetical protein
LKSFVRRKPEIDAAVREVIIFHSSAEELLLHTVDLPFDVVADLGKALYQAFGVETGKRALLDSRAWPAIARSVATSLPEVVSGERPVPPFNPAGGRYRPAGRFPGNAGWSHRSVQIRRARRRPMVGRRCAGARGVDQPPERSCLILAQ